MAELLYLVHRMPFPPDKGDKVRSYHLLRHLAARHRVHLGTFIDDPADEAHLPALRALCASVHAVRLHPRRARIASLAGLVTGQALTLHHYRDAGLMGWVRRLKRERSLDAAVVSCSAMAPYAEAADLPAWVDFVEVDSAKWTACADQHRWPMSWLYRREGRRLLAYERQAARQARRGFFATEKETERFRQLAPDCASRVEAMGNGVDAECFSPAPDRPSPFESGETPVVMIGAMDDVDVAGAVAALAESVLPRLRVRRPGLRLHLVGPTPAPALRSLAASPETGVVIARSGQDPRAWLQHAAMVLAPVPPARHAEIRTLEAMAMGRPVIAAAACVHALQAEPGREVLVADGPDETLGCIVSLLGAPDRAYAIGTAGRLHVLARHTWDTCFGVLERHLFALQDTVPDTAAAEYPTRALAA